MKIDRGSATFAACASVLTLSLACVFPGSEDDDASATPPASLATVSEARRADEGVVVHVSPARTLPGAIEGAIVARARLEVDRAVEYDASYYVLPYPNGDVPPDRGACTDVVIRALRAVGVDLQVLVHEDGGQDANVDHRRVSVLHGAFERHALSLPVDPGTPGAFRPGDVVFFAWKRCVSGARCVSEHVGIVSDRVGPRGLPLVIQNGGPRASEEDMLDHGTMTGHFRLNPLGVAVRSSG